MPETSKPNQSANSGLSGTNPNGFTTEREVDGERRSIRCYNDGRVSKRETDTKSRSIEISNELNVKNGSIEASLLPDSLYVSSESGYQASNAFGTAELRVAVGQILLLEIAGDSQISMDRTKEPIPTSAVTDSSETTPHPVPSTLPTGDPKFMDTETPPKGITSNANSISDQWLRMGVNSAHKDLEYN
jgi:hypothetical protein